jgi:hypothetical protein
MRTARPPAGRPAEPWIRRKGRGPAPLPQSRHAPRAPACRPSRRRELSLEADQASLAVGIGGSSGAGDSSLVPFANMLTARILFVASSAATLYASDSVG